MYSPNSSKKRPKTDLQPAPVKINGLTGMERMIIRFQVRAISVRVPGPPGNGRVAGQDKFVQPFLQRGEATFLFHPGIRLDRPPGFNVIACHADDVSTRFIGPAADGFHRADVAAGQDSVPSLGEQFSEFIGFRVGCVTFFGLGAAEYRYIHD